MNTIDGVKFKETLSSTPPLKKFDFPNNTVYAFPQSQDLLIDDDPDKKTLVQILKILFPQFKSYRQNLIPPDSILKVGHAMRKRIIQWANYLNRPPPDFLSTPLTTLFNYYRDEVTDEHEISLEYNCALYATNYDEQAATALLLYYGYAPRPKANKFEHNVIFSDTKTPTSITINPPPLPHTVDDRIAQAILRERTNDPAIQERAAFREYHNQRHSRISETNATHQEVQSIIINAIYHKIPPPITNIPHITHEPFEIKLSDFQFQSYTNNGTTFRQKEAAQMLSILEPKIEYTTAELEAIGIGYKRLKTLLANNKLIKIRRGVYKTAKNFYF